MTTADRIARIKELADRCRAAGHDERLSTGQLYLDAAAELDALLPIADAGNLSGGPSDRKPEADNVAVAVTGSGVPQGNCELPPLPPLPSELWIDTHTENIFAALHKWAHNYAIAAIAPYKAELEAVRGTSKGGVLSYHELYCRQIVRAEKTEAENAKLRELLLDIAKTFKGSNVAARIDAALKGTP